MGLKDKKKARPPVPEDAHANSESLIGIYHEARKAVPATKYAFGIAGTIAAISIVYDITNSWSLQAFLKSAVVVSITLVLVIAMIAVVQLSQRQGAALRRPAMAFAWIAFVIVPLLLLSVLMSSLFGGQPFDLRHVFGRPIVTSTVPSPPAAAASARTDGGEVQPSVPDPPATDHISKEHAEVSAPVSRRASDATSVPKQRTRSMPSTVTRTGTRITTKGLLEHLFEEQQERRFEDK